MASCIICDSGIEAVENFTSLCSVTSDCKPYENISEIGVCINCGHVQKFITPYFVEEVSQIYRNYEVFKLSSGVEQVVFDGSNSNSRSTLIASWVRQHLSLSTNNAILDYGCGDGSALFSFSQVFPDVNLYGYEIFEIERPKTKGISNFREMIIGPQLSTDIRFDLITLIHCLEHLDKPKEVLNLIHEQLTEGGHVFIEVPNLLKADYDILIADHVSHFDPSIIIDLLESCGFEVVELSTDLLTKEISVLAKKAKDICGLVRKNERRVKENLSRTQFLVRKNLNTVEAAKKIINEHSNVGIFGSSISAMWLWGELEKTTRIFVDEDLNKIQKNSVFEIISPEDVPCNYVVMVPLVDEIAEKIVKKYANYDFQMLKV